MWPNPGKDEVKKKGKDHFSCISQRHISRGYEPSNGEHRRGAGGSNEGRALTSCLTIGVPKGLGRIRRTMAIRGGCLTGG